LRAFAATVWPTEILSIHGFASEEGPSAFNDNLSCSRAEKARLVLMNSGITASQIRLYKHGATAGPRPERRSVVIDKSSNSITRRRRTPEPGNTPVQPQPRRPQFRPLPIIPIIPPPIPLPIRVPIPPPLPPPIPIVPRNRESGSKRCGPNVSRTVSTVWRQIEENFDSWPFRHKEAACRHLVQPFILEGWQPRWNVNAFDTIGLVWRSAHWLNFYTNWDPPCAYPPVLSPAGEQIDEHPDACTYTVEIGGNCWLTGTVNYGTYGIMMKTCSRWIDGLSWYHPFKTYWPLFQRSTVSRLVRLYKTRIAQPREDPTYPLAWALAAYDGRSSGTASGSNRPSCLRPCPLPYPPHPGFCFDYVWQPVKPPT
jgi:hypothetical protein